MRLLPTDLVSPRRALLPVLFLALVPAAVRAADKAPRVTLRDPSGASHNIAELLALGGVLVMTAPTYSEKDTQEGWGHSLPTAMPKGGVLIFVEDLSVSDWKSLAEAGIRRQWKPKTPPLVLLDETGSTRELLGEEANTTGVFVFCKKGKLVHTYRGDPSVKQAKVLWAKVK